MVQLEEKLETLAKAVEAGDIEKTQSTVKSLIKEGINKNTILYDGLISGIKTISEKFANLEVFLPDIIFSSEAIHAGIEILKEYLTEAESSGFDKGTVVIGTVQGDIHDVGKTIVASLLTANGFTVYDLGIDVSAEEFTRRAKDVDADIVVLSCLMTTTLARQKELIEDLYRLGLRDSFKVFVGGGAVTQSWADKIGADGYGEDASEAVDIAIKTTCQSEKP